MLSLIVPCYNEQENVNAFFDEVTKVFSEKVNDYEFVFVNDGSKDATYNLLCELYQKNKYSHNIQVLNFSRNFGKESAMFAGLEHAKGDMVCIIDADLQQRPEVVLEMLDELNADESLDCVAAFQEKRKENAFVSKVKSSFYKTISKMSEIEFVDGASDFRLMKRNMVDAILEMKEYHRFSKGIFSWVGFNCKYIPYIAADRNGGKSKWGFKSLMRYALEGIFAFSTAPLKISIYTGAISAIAALVYMIVVIIKRIACGVEVQGYATIVVLLLFIGGVQLLCLGFLGEYLARMYIQVKGRPIYVLKNHLGNDK